MPHRARRWRKRGSTPPSTRISWPRRNNVFYPARKRRSRTHDSESCERPDPGRDTVRPGRPAAAGSVNTGGGRRHLDRRSTLRIPRTRRRRDHAARVRQQRRTVRRLAQPLQTPRKIHPAPGTRANGPGAEEQVREIVPDESELGDLQFHSVTDGVIIPAENQESRWTVGEARCVRSPGTAGGRRRSFGRRRWRRRPSVAFRPMNPRPERVFCAQSDATAADPLSRLSVRSSV